MFLINPMEKETEKLNKKSNKGRIVFAIVLFLLAYLFIFKPLVVSHCQKQAQFPTYTYSPFSDSRPSGTSVNSEEYNNCIHQLDPIQNLKVIILWDK